MRHGLVAVLVAATLVSACARRDREPELMHIRSSVSAPDEFAILPTKPLQQPTTYAELPVPTPGGRNLVDPTPDADAVAALGGNPAALSRTGVPAADGGLYAQATRMGVTPGIRQQLASDDIEYRRRHDGRLMERIFNVNVYYRAYKPMSLNQHAELERWRAAGVRTPAAPPDPAVEY